MAVIFVVSKGDRRVLVLRAEMRELLGEVTNRNSCFGTTKFKDLRRK